MAGETCVLIGYGYYGCQRTSTISYTIGQKRCSGTNSETWDGAKWSASYCENGCLNGTCIASISTNVEVNRDDNGTTRDLTTILRDEYNNVITANTIPITVNTYSPTVEKTDDGFIRTITSTISNANSGEIVNAITQNINSIKKSNGDYCSYDNECQSNICDFSGSPVRRCTPSRLESAYTGANLLTFGAFGNYVSAYQNPYMAWQIQGFDSSRAFIEDCVAKNGISAAQNCTRQASALSQDALASSAALGTVITSEVALLGTGFGFASGSITGIQALTQGLAISSLYQTGSAVNICATNPDSVECRDATIWAVISWVNVGTAANLMNATQQTIQSAKLLNTGVNALNLAGDIIIDVSYNCFGENRNTLGCVLATGATVLDLGGGALDLVDMIRPSNLASVDIGVSQLDDYVGTTPTSIRDGRMGFSDSYLTNSALPNQPTAHLAQIINEAGINLSFPDITLNNVVNNIALGPLTGNISVGTLDTAMLLPNTNPTNLNQVVNQPIFLSAIPETGGGKFRIELPQRIQNRWDDSPLNWKNWVNRGSNFGDDALLGVGTTGSGTYKSLGGQKLVINPGNDVSLQQYLTDARYYLEQNRTDSSISRVNLLNDYVHKSLRYADPNLEYYAATQLRNELYSTGKANLGEFIDNRTGVCREYAACLHVALADNGKPNYMTIGDVDSVEGVSANQEGGRHAWVEYIDSITGEWMVADPTNGHVLPRDEAYNTIYLNVRNVEHEVFVWPEGTSLWQKVTKKITAN